MDLQVSGSRLRVGDQMWTCILRVHDKHDYLCICTWHVYIRIYMCVDTLHTCRLTYLPDLPTYLPTQLHACLPIYTDTRTCSGIALTCWPQVHLHLRAPAKPAFASRPANLEQNMCERHSSEDELKRPQPFFPASSKSRPHLNLDIWTGPDLQGNYDLCGLKPEL